METRFFSIGEMLKAGWAKFKEHPFTWVGALILIFLIMGSHVFVDNWAMGNGFNINFDDSLNPTTEIVQPTGLQILITIIYSLIECGFILGITYMGIRAADGLSINILHLFARFQYVFHYIISYFIYSIIVLVGFVLLIFPAVIWGSKFALFPYFIVDKGLGPIKALKASSQATYGAKWDIFSMVLITFCLVFLGIVALLLGILIVIPVINIAWCCIYRKLTAQKSTEQIVIPTTTNPGITKSL